MKKIVSLILALALIMSLSVTAFAAEAEGKKPGEDTTIDVSANRTEDVDTVNVYSVDLAWDAMTFTYAASGTKTWNPETHEYDTDATAKWENTTATITATNHSDLAVTVTFAYTDADANDGVNGALDITTDTLESAVGKTLAEADSVTATLTISGTPTDAVTEAGVKVGTITITIA